MAFRRNDLQFTLVRSETCDLSGGGSISESLQTCHSIVFFEEWNFLKRNVAAPPGGHFAAVAQQDSNQGTD